MYSFLMIGQSNMAGRGHFEDVEPIENDRLYVLRNGRWQHMFVPVNPDRKFSGVSLAESFADDCSKYYGADVGLIPCADGGTTLDQWQPGEVLYDHAVFQAKLAMRTSTLAGILWHQGESDCEQGREVFYEEKCMRIFESLKKELGLTDVPFIVGGLGAFLLDRDSMYVTHYVVNDALQKMAREQDYIGYVSAEGLTGKRDNLHFNAVSLREFGHRYFDVFKSMNTMIKENAGEVYEDGLTEIEKL